MHRWSSAFIELVFPFSEPGDDFADLYDAVCDATKMKLPPGAMRQVSPIRAGKQKWRKLGAWRHG